MYLLVSGLHNPDEAKRSLEIEMTAELGPERVNNHNTVVSKLPAYLLFVFRSILSLPWIKI